MDKDKPIMSTSKINRKNVCIKLPKPLHEKVVNRSRELNMNITQYLIFLATQDTTPEVMNRQLSAQ